MCAQASLTRLPSSCFAGHIHSMNQRILLAASLLANVVLFFFLGRPSASTPAPAAEPTPTVKTVTNTVVRRQTEHVAGAEKTVVVEKKLDWGTVESADFKTYIANLRDIKCPEETIRDIVIADINKLYATRFKTQFVAAASIKYWEPFDNQEVYQRQQKQQVALDLERKQLIRDLLGVDPDTELRRQSLSYNFRDLEERLLDFLPEDKRKQAMDIRAWARSEVEKIESAARDRALTPEEEAATARIRNEERAQMRKTLGEQGNFDYNLRTSLTAIQLRERMSGYQPTEKEYVAVFTEQAWLKNELTKLTRTGDGTITPEQRQALQAQSEQRLAQQLGAERYQEFQHTQDRNYRELMRQAGELAVPRDRALSFYFAQREFNSGRQAIERNPQLTPEQRAEGLRVIEAKFRSVAGDLAEKFKGGQ